MVSHQSSDLVISGVMEMAVESKRAEMQKRILTLILPGVHNYGTVFLLTYLPGSLIMLFQDSLGKGRLMARCTCLVYTLSISKDISLPAAATLLESGQLDTEMC